LIEIQQSRRARSGLARARRRGHLATSAARPCTCMCCDGGPSRMIERVLPDENSTEELEGSGGARYRVFASSEAGVHALPLADAAALVRAAPHRSAAAEDQRIIWIDINRPGEPDGAFLRDELRFH